MYRQAKCTSFIALLIFVLSLIVTRTYADITIQTKVTGVPPDIEKKVVDGLPLIAYKNYIQDNPERLRILYSRSINTIKESLKPFGYYHAQVSASLTRTQPLNWQAVFNVKLGPPVRLTAVIVKIEGAGKALPELQQIITQPPLQIGKIINQFVYQSYKNQMLNTAVELGFLDASLSKHEIRIDPFNNTAKVALTLSTGVRYHFGKITFQQKQKEKQKAFATAFLNRFLSIKTGDNYEYTEVQALQNDLMASQYFSDVNIHPDIQKEKHLVNLNIELTPTDSQQYTLGIGYGTETNVRGLLGWQLNRIGQYGQRFSTSIEASQLYRTFTLRYIFPGANPLTDQKVLSAGQSYTQVNPYSSLESTVGFTKIQQLGPWKASYGIQTHFLNYSLPDSANNHDHYLMPFLGLTYANTQEEGYFQSGYIISFATEGALSGLLSSSSFLKGTLNLKRSWTLSSSTSFFNNTFIGVIQTQDFEGLAVPLRFFAGGVGTIRGYDYLSLSPTNSSGNLIGGRYLFTTSFNFEQHLFSELSALVFYDAGNAFNTFSTLSLYQGAGLGLSWKTSVGPIQVYFSHPIKNPGKWHFDVSVGAFL